MSDRARLKPRVTPENEHFWTGGARGELRFLQCQECAYTSTLPPRFVPGVSRHLVPETVSGRGRVFSFTINHHKWHPELEVPYVIALVQIDEQPELRLTTNIVDCPIDAVHIGMEVEVKFFELGDVYIPLFKPVSA